MRKKGEGGEEGGDTLTLNTIYVYTQVCVCVYVCKMFQGSEDNPRVNPKLRNIKLKYRIN